METELADLIRSYSRDEIWPYLYLRSCHAIGEAVSQDAAASAIGTEALNVLIVSGFIEIDKGRVVLQRDDGTWLHQPPMPPKRTILGPSNFDKQLERIAKLTGWPVDMDKNRGYYRARFKALLDKKGFDRIDIIAYNNRGVGLKRFLTPSIFKSLEIEFEAESLD